jgi:5-methylcytosine-specific restriction endonuclease McrBC GTP-binding regulatory subunit McrB
LTDNFEDLEWYKIVWEVKMADNKFTWVQTHKELVNYLKGQQEHQQDLINLLKDVGVTGISDGNEIELSEIDPFTFFFYIYKYKSEKSLAVLQKIASNLGLPKPEDIDGIPLTNGVNVRFFPDKKDRNKNEINRLWDFFFKAIEHTITDADFLDILQIKGVGKPKLTQGLFMIDPENYLCLDKQTIPYLNRGKKIKTEFTNYTEYNEILNEVRDKVNEPFYKISYDAWKWNSNKKYWLFSPGNNAEKWQEFYDSNIMAVGWNKIEDLRNYHNKEEIAKDLQDDPNSNKDKRNDAKCLWDFKTDLQPGDVIFVKLGKKVLGGYGIVASDYYYDPTKEDYRHCRKVDWKLKGEWQYKSEKDLPNKTLTEITTKKSTRVGLKYFYEELFQDMVVKEVELNLILYGPPGTGKTYNSINKAVEIIDPVFMKGKNNNKEADRKEITDRYRGLEEEGCIVFITFHQSLSYEDFVEGIKPVIKEDQNNTLSYEIVPGIFKQLCDRASLPCGSSLRNAYKELKKNLANSKNFERKYKTPEGEEFGLSLWGDNITLHYGTELKQRTIVTRDKLTSFLLKKNEPSASWTYYQGIINLLKKEYGFDEQNTSNGNYVLIIDEINRGNVSQIFGELITLIEKDKRAGKEEALNPILPYSKTKFSVPANLYIIGTMNTADRSVEALDTALRRRFSFVEMTPDYSLLEDKTATVDKEDINLGNLLDVLNQRIEGLMDRDHLLGHSYFLQVAKGEFSLKHIFFNEIIPLLQEYFYGNDEKLQLILGKGFVKDEPAKQNIYAKTKIDISDYDDRPRYSIVKDEAMNESEFVMAIKTLLKENENNIEKENEKG